MPAYFLKHHPFLYLQSCSLESKVRKKRESIAFPFLKARNVTLVLFFIDDLVCLNPMYEKDESTAFIFLRHVTIKIEKTHSNRVGFRIQIN